MPRARLDAIRTSTWLRGCAHVGQSPRLYGRPSVNLDGGTIHIGNHFRLSSRPVTSHFVAGPDALLEIGDDVAIGHGAAIAAYQRVQIGTGTRIAPFVIIMDTNFHGGSGRQSVQHECRPVIIGRNCRVGSRVTITRGVSIGDEAEILAGSVVSSDIPAGSCAGGARARVIGRSGDPGVSWDSPAAILPFLIMDALGLQVLPELDAPLSQVGVRYVGGAARVTKAISAYFHIEVAATDVLEARSLRDLASIVDQLKRRRPEVRNTL